MKLALVLLVALAAPAYAKRDPACTCPSKRVLPAPGAVDVPTNARFWRLPSQTPGQPIQPYELAAHTGFVLENTSFTTGAGPDDEPPIAPSVAGASITLAGTRIEVLRVTAATSADTAVVHLRLLAATHEVDYYTTPDQLDVCDPEIEFPPGHVRIDVSAIDLAGNESAPDSTELDTTDDPFPAASCATAAAVGAAPDERAGTGLAFLIALAGIGLFLSRANLRRRDRELVAVEPFALPAAEQLARVLRLRSLATIALAGIATSYVLNAPAVTDYALAASPLGAALLIDAVRHYVQAGRARVLLRYDGATANVQHDTVEIDVGKQRATLRASPRLVDRARHHALPRATL